MSSLRIAASGVIGCLLLVPSAALAQPQVTAVTGSFPDRYVNGAELAAAQLRQSPFDPNGISYSDCTAATALTFTLTTQGFSPGQQLQVWGSLQSNTTCPQASARTSSPPTCWPLSQPFDAPPDGTSAYTVQVRDLVGYQKATPSTTYAPLDATACTAQSGQDAVWMYIWFLPIDTTSNEIVTDAVLYQYAVATDLVGPAPPVSSDWSIGDGYLTANWAANTDSDTIGYDVFMDPPLSGAGDGGPFVECPETGDTEDCFTVVPGGGLAGDAGQCRTELGDFPNAVTTTSTEPTVDGGEAGDAAPTSDEASTTETEGGTVTTVAGIGGIPTKYLVNQNGTGLSVLGKTNGSLQVNGLTDGSYYAFVVAAVDLEGNVGPASSLWCDFPDRTTDFFQTYKADGGAAGGGCALESGAAGGGVAAGGIVMVVAASAWRRRRSASKAPRSAGTAK